jgi:hypothetical protein
LVARIRPSVSAADPVADQVRRRLEVKRVGDDGTTR